MTEQQTTPAAQLDALMANPDWAKQYLAGSGPHVKEAHALIEAKAGDKAVAATRLDQIVAGTVEIPFMETTTPDQQLSTYQLTQAAAALRGANLTDDEIKQAIAGGPVAKAEYDKVKTLRDDLMGNKEFAAKYLAGDVAASRQILLANIVISNGYVGQERTS